MAFLYFKLGDIKAYEKELIKVRKNDFLPFSFLIGQYNLSLVSDQSESYFNFLIKGADLVLNGEYEKAISFLEKSIDLYPNNRINCASFDYLIYAYIKLNDADKVLERIEQFEENTPLNSFQKEIKKYYSC